MGTAWEKVIIFSFFNLFAAMDVVIYIFPDLLLA